MTEQGREGRGGGLPAKLHHSPLALILVSHVRTLLQVPAISVSACVCYRGVMRRVVALSHFICPPVLCFVYELSSYFVDVNPCQPCLGI